LIGAFKTISTKQINALRGSPGAPLWQRNYYERIIRDENELDRIRCYIQDNPAAWDIDRENPAAEPTKNAEFWQM
jgi:REP element-mobilizing transposase RayT